MITQLAELARYSTVALVVSLNAIGASLGQGFTSVGALTAINLQPQARDMIARSALISMALIETSAIMSAFITLMLLASHTNQPYHYFAGIAHLGTALAMCLTGCTIGIISALPGSAACMAIARQPLFSDKILKLSVLTLSLIQTPIIMGFVISLMIQKQIPTVETLNGCMRIIASGLSIGLGSIGPAIGMALFAQAAIESVGKNKNAYNPLFSFSLISQTMIETPAIFAMVISIILLTVMPPDAQAGQLGWVLSLSSALCIGISTIGTSISSGRTAAAAARQIAANLTTHQLVSRASIFAQALIETSAIYPMLVSLVLLLYI